MRRFLSSLMTSGGLMALMAFFLPWVTVSCNGNRIMSVTPMERASGTTRAELAEYETEVTVRELDSAETPGQTPEPGYWLLLIPAIIVTACGALLFLRAWGADRGVGSVGAAAGGAGVITTVVLGLQGHLGMSAPEGTVLAATLAIDADIGVWISLGAYVLAISGGLGAALLAGKLDRDWG